MLRRLTALAGACFLAMAWATPQASQQTLDDLRRQFLDPPADARIMMRWWWFGPAVTGPEIERELRAMQAAGIGGVEIQSVYPLSPDDEQGGVRNLPFLSDAFLDALRFAGATARGLGLRLDLTLGSGWPYGGPDVAIDRAAGRIRHERVTVAAGVRRVPIPPLDPGERLIAAFLSTPDGHDRPAELTDLHDGAAWLPAAADRPRIVSLFVSSRTGQMVKRAAAGAEGFVLDHYDRAALDTYLAHTGERLLGALAATPPFAIFCDSLEVYQSDWTPDFLREFTARRGYDLKPHLPALVDDAAADAPALRDDWGRTLAELVGERFVSPLAAWAHAHGTRLRLQGYGSPPATISTNALADLPEGEGADWRGLSASRWASSASHIYDRAVTSSETWTWLHSPVFRASPLDLKAEADLHFLQGINQLVGHGWPYSPPDAAYPGWRLYAASALDDKNPWWIVMPDVSRYLQRVSFVLRQGTPVSDVAIYVPSDDAFAHFRPGHVELIEMLRQGMGPDLSAAVLDAGYSFDFFDDRALQAAGRVESGALRLGRQRYRIVILPGVERIPIDTLTKLDEFARAGGLLVATRRLPDLAPGFLAAPGDHARVKELARQLFQSDHAPGRFVTDERALFGEELRRRLVPDVSLSPAAADVGFIHRRLDDVDVYFVTNTGNVPRRATATFRTTGTNAESWDAIEGTISPAAMRPSAPGTASVALDLEAYSSRVLVFSRGPTPRPPKKTEATALASGSLDLNTDWMVTFGEGAKPTHLDRLQSWTDEESTRFFSGVAIYEKEIPIPADVLARGKRVVLAFGEAQPVPPQTLRAGVQAWLDAPVRDAAIVSVNGVRAGSVWCPPYSLDVTRFLRPGANRLRIQVGNLALNAMAGRPLPEYRLLNLRYGRRFDPQDMDKVQAQPAGLLGPVRLIELRQ